MHALSLLTQSVLTFRYFWNCISSQLPDMQSRIKMRQVYWQQIFILQT